MLNKTEQKQFEAKVGPLELIPKHLQQELLQAFKLALLQDKKQKALHMISLKPLEDRYGRK